VETTITVSSVFKAPAEKIWGLLGQVNTLQKIAKPYVYFTAPEGISKWKPGTDCRMLFRLYGLIPMGEHKIRVARWDKASWTIETHESDRLARVWNHSIDLEPLGDGTTRYTDTVVIDAGRLTPLVRLWSVMFYRHRQRKWKRLLRIDGALSG
jgi:ligand-binding SRPBCC domain-containing protein